MLRYFIKYIFNILIIFISSYLILLDNKFKSHDSNASNFSKKNLLVLEDLELKELEDSNSFQSFNAHYYLGGQYFLYPPVCDLFVIPTRRVFTVPFSFVYYEIPYNL